MAKTEDEKAAAKRTADRAKASKTIIAHPTASDAQVASMADVERALVTDIRSEMGPKHSWPKPKEEKT